jgi:hypothetical protein
METSQPLTTDKWAGARSGPTPDKMLRARAREETDLRRFDDHTAVATAKAQAGYSYKMRLTQPPLQFLADDTPASTDLG